MILIAVLERQSSMVTGSSTNGLTVPASVPMIVLGNHGTTGRRGGPVRVGRFRVPSRHVSGPGAPGLTVRLCPI